MLQPGFASAHIQSGIKPTHQQYHHSQQAESLQYNNGIIYNIPHIMPHQELTVSRPFTEETTAAPHHTAFPTVLSSPQQHPKTVQSSFSFFNSAPNLHGTASLDLAQANQRPEPSATKQHQDNRLSLNASSLPHSPQSKETNIWSVNFESASRMGHGHFQPLF